VSQVPAIDRRAPLPFYSQLQQLIVADIADRGLEPGDRLPGEFELCERFGLSRAVVRQALAGLERDGVVVREKGRGTFVADQHSAQGIGGPLVGSFEDIQSGAGAQHSRLLRRGHVPASASVARDLQVKEGSLVVEIERLRDIDGIPWAYTRTQLPADVGGQLLDVDLEDVSLFAVLEERFGIRFERAQRTVEAQVASPAVSSRLDLEAGAAVLVMHSVSFDQHGRAVERFTGFHRGDLSRLDIAVSKPVRTGA